MPSTSEIIDQLKLEPHPEGGYFRRTYTSGKTAAIGPDQSDRPTLTCIYYLLTNESPIGSLHVNQSDIAHFFHQGDPITYTLVSPGGNLETVTMGPDIASGHKLQLMVPGGWWKASELASGEFGLISEAVSPGFDYDDMAFVTTADIASRCPGLEDQLDRFVSKR